MIIEVDEQQHEVEVETDCNGVEIYKVPDFPGIEGRVAYEEEGAFWSPREWSNVGTMAVSYRGYDLGDEDIREWSFRLPCEACDGSGWDPHDDDSECPKCEGEGNPLVDPVTFIKQERGAQVVLPLIVYDHSGITMRVGHVGSITGDAEGWDTSFVGFYFDTPDGVKECMGECSDDKQIEAALRQEVETYASYLEGDVTCWNVEDFDLPQSAEGCGGYIGSIKECRSEMLFALKSAIKGRIKENKERQYWLEREVETV